MIKPPIELTRNWRGFLRTYLILVVIDATLLMACAQAHPGAGSVKTPEETSLATIATLKTTPAALSVTLQPTRDVSKPASPTSMAGFARLTVTAAIPTHRPTALPIPSTTPKPTNTAVPLPTLPGWPAANFLLPALNTNVEKLTLLDLRGKPLVLGFFATWCMPCRYEVPQIIAAYQQHKDEVQFIYIDMEEPEHVVRAFIEKMSLPYPVLMDVDRETARSYRVLSIPMTFFIDSNGRIINYYLGMVPPEIFEARLQELHGH